MKEMEKFQMEEKFGHMGEFCPCKKIHMGEFCTMRNLTTLLIRESFVHLRKSAKIHAGEFCTMLNLTTLLIRESFVPM